MRTADLRQALDWRRAIMRWPTVFAPDATMVSLWWKSRAPASQSRTAAECRPAVSTAPQPSTAYASPINFLTLSFPKALRAWFRSPCRQARAFAACFFCVAGLLIGAKPARGQGAGAIIEGRVQSASTGKLLNNARVVVEGTNLEVLTDAEGIFRLLNVPAGAVRIRVSYTGMETQTASVNLAAGTAARRDFALDLPAAQTSFDPKDVLKLDSFVVESTALSAAAAAQNEQKMAPNIKNVVVLDEIGELADGNIGEYLKYSPGAAIRADPQQAEALSIRGMPGNTVVFLMDGAEFSNPSTDRVFSLSASAPANVDRIEITKVPTPDRPANAVGGTVNVIAKSALGAKRPVLKLDLQGTYNTYDRFSAPSFSERWGAEALSGGRARLLQPGATASYVHPVSPSLAFTLTLSELRRLYPMEFIYPQWNMVSAVLTQSQLQGYFQHNGRALAAGNVDWRLSSSDSLRFTVDHLRNTMSVRRPRYFAIFGAGVTGGPAFSQGAATGVDTIRQQVDYNDRVFGTTSAGVRYRHDGRLYRIDANAHFSRSWDDRVDTDHGFFSSTGQTQATNLIVRADGLDGVYSRRAPRYSATTRTGAAFNPYDAAELTLGNPQSAPRQIVADVRTLSANVARPFGTAAPTTLKAGFAINTQRKDVVQTTRTWTFTPPAGGSRLVRDYDVVSGPLSAQSMFDDTFRARWVSPAKLHALSRARPELFVLNEAAAYQSRVSNSKFFEETVSAAYLRADVKLLANRLLLVGGARFEKTEDYGAGPRDDLRATYRTDAAGNLLRDAAGRPIPITTDALGTARLRYQERGAEARKAYSGWYPSLNATYSITEDLLIRAAFAQTLGRPNLTQIIPGLTVPDPSSTNQTLSLVNAGLEPWTANNYDISLEAYGIKGATIAVSLFRKELKGFFASTVSPVTPDLLSLYGLGNEFSSFLVATRRNGGSANVEGYELSWRQAWYFLPAWARGFSTFANATITRRGGPSAADLGDVESPFQHKNLNWGASYVRRNLSLRFNMSYMYQAASFAVAPGATVPAGVTQYIAPQITQDWSAEYRFTKRLSAYASARNFTLSTLREERSGGNAPAWTRPFQYRAFGSLVTLGMRAEY